MTPTYCTLDTEGGTVQLRVAVIGVEHEDQRLIEWLEGPKHSERECVNLDRLAHVAAATTCDTPCDCAVVPNYPYCEDGARNGGRCRRGNR